MRKITYVLLLLALLTSFVANTKAQHIEFQGLYLGMDRDAVDSLTRHSLWDYKDPEWTSEYPLTKLIYTAKKEYDIFSLVTIQFNTGGQVEWFSLSLKDDFKKQEESEQWYKVAVAALRELYGAPTFEEDFAPTYTKIKNKKFEIGHDFAVWHFPSPYAFVDLEGITTNIQISVAMGVADGKIYWSILFSDRSLSDIGH